MAAGTQQWSDEAGDDWRLSRRLKMKIMPGLATFRTGYGASCGWWGADGLTFHKRPHPGHTTYTTPYTRRWLAAGSSIALPQICPSFLCSGQSPTPTRFLQTTCEGSTGNTLAPALQAQPILGQYGPLMSQTSRMPPGNVVSDQVHLPLLLVSSPSASHAIAVGQRRG